MPLVSIRNELIRASCEGYALPLFDTFDMNATDGIINAFEKKRCPGIIGLYSSFLERPNARAISAYIIARAESSPLPISLMLDHGNSVENCMKAIDLGFTDVMYDGSRLPFEENIKNTKSVVDLAHKAGVCVEAELGHVGSGREYQNYGAQRKGFTDPNLVKTFVEETGIDYLAIAIGTAHGIYDGDPNIDLELLREIRSRIDIPLVLHGGTGCSEEQFRAVIKNGISKINIATDLFLNASKRMVEVAKGENVSYFLLCKTATEAFQERCEYYIELFGAKDKADISDVQQINSNT